MKLRALGLLLGGLLQCAAVFTTGCSSAPADDSADGDEGALMSDGTVREALHGYPLYVADDRDIYTLGDGKPHCASIYAHEIGRPREGLILWDGPVGKPELLALAQDDAAVFLAVAKKKDGRGPDEHPQLFAISKKTQAGKPLVEDFGMPLGAIKTSKGDGVFVRSVADPSVGYYEDRAKWIWRVSKSGPATQKPQRVLELNSNESFWEVDERFFYAFKGDQLFAYPLDNFTESAGKVIFDGSKHPRLRDWAVSGRVRLVGDGESFRAVLVRDIDNQTHEEVVLDVRKGVATIKPIEGFDAAPPNASLNASTICYAPRIPSERTPDYKDRLVCLNPNSVRPFTVAEAPYRGSSYTAFKDVRVVGNRVFWTNESLFWKQFPQSRKAR